MATKQIELHSDRDHIFNSAHIMFCFKNNLWHNTQERYHSAHSSLTKLAVSSTEPSTRKINSRNTNCVHGKNHGKTSVTEIELMMIISIIKLHEEGREL